MNIDIDDLIQDTIKLVSLPDVYYRLEEAINHPHTSLDDMGEIIASDPNLASRLLRIANSAFFGFPEKIESIKRAIITVGTQQLRDLVLATTVISRFSKMPNVGCNMRSFWEHSIAVGVTARIIANHHNENNAERFYVAGLMHDIGRLVLYIKQPDIMRQLLEKREKNNVLLYMLERDTFGFDHATVGGTLLNAWHVPQSLYEPVYFHHEPESAQNYPTETMAIHIADIIVNGFKIGSSGERLIPPPYTDAWQHLAIDSQALTAITHTMEQSYQDTVMLFLADTVI